MFTWIYSFHPCKDMDNLTGFTLRDQSAVEGTGETAQHLRTLTALGKELCLVSSTHPHDESQMSVPWVSGNPTPSSGLDRTLHVYSTQTLKLKQINLLEEKC